MISLPIIFTLALFVLRFLSVCRLWAHASVTGDSSFPWVCYAVPNGKDVVGCRHTSGRKHVIVFTLPGCHSSCCHVRRVCANGELGDGKQKWKLKPPRLVTHCVISSLGLKTATPGHQAVLRDSLDEVNPVMLILHDYPDVTSLFLHTQSVLNDNDLSAVLHFVSLAYANDPLTYLII